MTRQAGGGRQGARGVDAEPVYLILPYPPTVNRIWRHVGNRTLKSEVRATLARLGGVT